EELGTGVAGEGPAMHAVVLHAAGDDLPGAVGFGAIKQRNRLGREVFVLSVPAQFDVARGRQHLAGPQLHERAGGIHFDGAMGRVAADRRFAAEAVAVGDDDADAVLAVAGEVDFRGAAFAGVVRDAMPGLAFVGRLEDFNLADAARPDLVDAVFNRGVRRIDQLIRGRAAIRGFRQYRRQLGRGDIGRWRCDRNRNTVGCGWIDRRRRIVDHG